MARTKTKHDMALSRARPRRLWFDGFSPRDLNHVLSLIDMGIDSKRTSRSEEVSSKSHWAYPSLLTLGSSVGFG